jgi:nucleoside phosphorylase
MDTLISDHTDQLLLLVVPTIHEFNAIQPAVKDLLSSGRIELVMSGMGLQAVTSFCQMLEERDRPLSGLALLGWAGGLSPDLRAGDVVVAGLAMNTSGGLHPCKVIPLPGATIGPVLTLPTPVITPQEKNAHRASGALAVEMESYPLAEWAQASGLLFIHARVVLDAFDESLPDLGDALDTFGRVYPLKLTAKLLARPHLIGQLFRLSRKVRILAPSLSRLARAVGESWFEWFPTSNFRKAPPTRN